MVLKNEIKNIVGVVLAPIVNLFHMNTGSLTVFNYHDVTHQPSEFEKEYDLFVTPDAFEKQIIWVKNNYNIIHPKDIVNGKSIPKRAALITFDDGFLGAFENGLKILNKHNVPSIMFLNMYTVLEKKPMLSALVCYMEKYVSDFSVLAERERIVKPYYLTMTPCAIEAIKNKMPDIDMQAILSYQGEVADVGVLEKWSGMNVVYGNHLYDHWNCKALTDSQLEEQYLKNEQELLKLNNHMKYFAFTNGTPEICFTNKDVSILNSMGAKAIFTTSGGVNINKGINVFGRMNFTNDDTKTGLLWFRVMRAILSEFRQIKIFS